METVFCVRYKLRPNKLTNYETSIGNRIPRPIRDNCRKHATHKKYDATNAYNISTRNGAERERKEK